MEAEKTSISIPQSLAQIQSVLSQHPSTALPTPQAALTAASTLHGSLPPTGLGSAETLKHLLSDITPGLNGPKTSANYYGFVTGGVLPIAEAADHVVTGWDQNVGVHLPEQSVATVVEARALEMLVELLNLDSQSAGGADLKRGGRWEGKIFTTGATGSNVLGLACGREYVLENRLRNVNAPERDEKEGVNGESALAEKKEEIGIYDSVGELGLLEACRRAGVERIQVLTSMGHSSLSKAASIVGLGRQSVIEVGLKEAPWRFDFKKLEEKLARKHTASIVAVSCGEVNTGRFATSGIEEMKRLRRLCNQYGAWLHVDGAFGLFARALPPTEEFALLRQACEGMELADSITGDAHKALNVPYDCGFFLTHSLRTLTHVCQNPNAAYLATPTAPAASDLIPSPLNINLENSRRFRALPAYAVLVAHGRRGLSTMLARQVRLARAVARVVHGHPGFELLPAAERSASAPQGTARPASAYASTGIIVLFRAVDDEINRTLATRINRSCKIMVSGTAWEGKPAVRIAVSTWKADDEKDLQIVKEVLEGALFEEKSPRQ